MHTHPNQPPRDKGLNTDDQSFKRDTKHQGAENELFAPQMNNTKKTPAKALSNAGNVGSIVLSSQLVNGRPSHKITDDETPPSVLSAKIAGDSKAGVSHNSDLKGLEFSPAKKPTGHNSRNSTAATNAAGTLKGLFNIAWHEVFDPLVISVGKDFLPNGAALFSTVGFLYSTFKGALQLTSKQLFGQKLASDLKQANDKVKNMGANRTNETKITQSFTALDTEESRERAGGVGEAMSGQVPRSAGQSL